MGRASDQSGKKAKTLAKREPSVSPERKLFGLKLAQAREKAGLSQRNMTEATGITAAYVSGVERGLRNVGIDHMARLAEAVGVPLHKLLKPDH